MATLQALSFFPLVSYCSLLAAVAASNTPFLFSVEASTDKRKEEELSPPVQAGGLKGFLFFLKGEAALRKNKRMPLVVSMIFPLGLGAQRKNKDVLTVVFLVSVTHTAIKPGRQPSTPITPWCRSRRARQHSLVAVAASNTVNR